MSNFAITISVKHLHHRPNHTAYLLKTSIFFTLYLILHKKINYIFHFN